MAKKTTNLDEFFKEKLTQDSITPSKLAWERLESQLPAKDKSKTPLIWWSAAAAVTAILVASYFAFTLTSDPTTGPVLASTEESQVEQAIGQEIEITNETIQESDAPIVPKVEESTNQNTKPTTSTSQKPTSKTEKSSTGNLVALSTERPKEEIQEKAIKATPILEDLGLPALEIPNLQLEQAVATAEQPKVEEPAYRVKIYSDGLEEDKSLIGEISKKVEKVEGLLGKVDQGFADLQDAKSNLFISLLSKKEKTAEKP